MAKTENSKNQIKSGESEDYVISVRFEKQLEPKLKDRAREEKRSINNLLNIIVEKYLDNRANTF